MNSLEQALIGIGDRVRIVGEGVEERVGELWGKVGEVEERVAKVEVGVGKVEVKGLLN